LTKLTSAPDAKSIGIEYCQKIGEKVSLIPFWYCIRKVSLLLASILEKYHWYYW